MNTGPEHRVEVSIHCPRRLPLYNVHKYFIFFYLFTLLRSRLGTTRVTGEGKEAKPQDPNKKKKSRDNPRNSRRPCPRSTRKVPGMGHPEHPGPRENLHRVYRISNYCAAYSLYSTPSLCATYLLSISHTLLPNLLRTL